MRRSGIEETSELETGRGEPLWADAIQLVLSLVYFTAHVHEEDVEMIER